MTSRACLALSLLLASPTAWAADARPVVAVFDVQADSAVKKKDVKTLTELVATHLAASGRFKIVPSSDLKKALDGKKRGSYQACYDERCQIEIGRELAAEKTLSTRVSKLGSTCVVTMQLYDLRESAAGKAATAKGKCGIDAIVALLELASSQLSGARAASAAPSGAPPPPSGAFDHLATEIAQAKETPAIVEAREKKARTDAALADWAKVEAYAKAVEVERKSRADVLRRFLEAHPADNPKASTAKTMIEALETGWDPGLPPLRVRWVFSKPAGIEFSKTEVTIGDYKTCVHAGRCEATLEGCGQAQFSDGHAISCLTRPMAESFCAFAGGRLPTPEEWIAEATNQGTRRYPWGETKVSCQVAVVYGRSEHGCDTGWQLPPCTRPTGNSVSGLCDMIGNVSEWTAGESEPGRARIMGGDYGYEDDMYRPGLKGVPMAIDGVAGGIRCARDRPR